MHEKKLLLMSVGREGDIVVVLPVEEIGWTGEGRVGTLLAVPPPLEHDLLGTRP